METTTKCKWPALRVEFSKSKGKALQCFLSCLLRHRVQWTILYEGYGDNAVPQFPAAVSFKRTVLAFTKKTKQST